MEITNEERREVAGRIRERICRNHRAAWDVVLELSYIDVFGDRFRMNKEFTLFLADLIDRPTCKNVSEFGSHTVTVSNFAENENFDFVCSRCGIHLDGGETESSPLTDEKFARHALRFCPNCGAEVVE